MEPRRVSPLCSNRATLHKDDRLLPIATDRRRGQTKYVLRLRPPQYDIEGDGADVVAFIDDYLPILLDQCIHFPLARQRLHNGDVDVSGRSRLAAANGADKLFIDTKKGLQPLLPLR